jgi:hypothetical protein
MFASGIQFQQWTRSNSRKLSQIYYQIIVGVVPFLGSYILKHSVLVYKISFMQSTPCIILIFELKKVFLIIAQMNSYRIGKDQSNQDINNIL